MEEISITKSKLNYSGYFDFGDFYTLLWRTLKDMGYVVIEENYKRAVKQGGEEINIAWSAFKNVDDYTRFKIGIRILILGLSKAEIKLPNGATVKKDKGTIYVNFSASIQTDYLNKWEVHPIMKFLKGFYDYYIYRKQMESLTSKLLEELGALENEIKSYFQMATFM